jgi:CHAD domain-containing protein
VSSIKTGDNEPKAKLHRNSRPHTSLPADALETLLRSSKKQWKRYRKELKRCQRKFSEKAVHSSRIETRRLLSFAELLGPFAGPRTMDKVCICLKRHLDVFAELRDVHVQRGLLKKLPQTYPAAAFCNHLRKREKKLARRTREKVQRSKTKRLARLIATATQDAGCWINDWTPAENNLRIIKAVSTAFDRTVELRQRIDPARSETLHCTRVAFKKFRYMVEALSNLLPMPAGFSDALHDYQTRMGNVQDLEVLLQSFRAFAKKRQLEQAPTAELCRDLARRKNELISCYLARADQLYSFWPASGRPNRHAQPVPSAGARNGHSSTRKSTRSRLNKKHLKMR